jgi:hypothetical protein
MVFDDGWFRENQSWIIKLINHKNRLVKLWFRHCLRIDYKFAYETTVVYPCHTMYRDEFGKLHGNFRTYDKYARRMFFAFRPLWIALHILDNYILPVVAPQLNFGFDTLPTKYPAASNAGTTCDGYVTRDVGTEETFATIRAGAGTAFAASATTIIGGALSSGGTSGYYYAIRRAFYSFDTSPIGAGKTISAEVFSLRGTDYAIGLGATGLSLCAVAGSGAPNTLAASVYGLLGGTKFAEITSSAWSVAGYNAFTFNADGITDASMTGITKIGTKLGWDVDNNFTGTWGADTTSSFTNRSADYTGTTSDPKLDITYATAASGITFIPYIMAMI